MHNLFSISFPWRYFSDTMFKTKYLNLILMFIGIGRTYVSGLVP